MDLTHDALLVSLRISAWSGRLYDRKASNHVAVHHEASASAGRYNRPPRGQRQRRALQQVPAAQGRLRRAHRHHEQGT